LERAADNPEMLKLTAAEAAKKYKQTTGKTIDTKELLMVMDDIQERIQELGVTYAIPFHAMIWSFFKT